MWFSEKPGQMNASFTAFLPKDHYMFSYDLLFYKICLNKLSGHFQIQIPVIGQKKSFCVSANDTSINLAMIWMNVFMMSHLFLQNILVIIGGIFPLPSIIIIRPRNVVRTGRKSGQGFINSCFQEFLIKNSIENLSIPFVYWWN